MTIYTKPSDLPAWAESGDKVQPSNAEIQTGWPLSTVPPSRQRFNWLLNWLATGVRYFMQRGIPEWDITEEYPAGARVQYNNVTYVSLTGTSNTGQQPDTATTFWEQWAYTDTAFQPRVDQLTAFTVTTADVTLTAAQAKAGILNVTGTLTGNRNIIIPNAARRFIVINGTSGAFTLGVKTASGVAVTVGQGGASSIVCDGNNNIKLASADLTAYAPIASPTFTGNPAAPTPAQFDNDTSLATTEFVQRALGSFSGVTSYAGAATLTAADVGKAILASGGTFTLTLPAASAVPAGGCIQVFCNSGTVTVQRAGADVISGASSTTSVVLGVGDTIKLRSNGTAGWLAVEGTARLGSALGFKTALNASGDAPVYACRAWVNFNGTGTVAIRASGNVSSITDNSSGNYTVNFTTPMPDTNYSPAFFVSASSTSNFLILSLLDSEVATFVTTNSFRFTTAKPVDSNRAIDSSYVSLCFFR